MPIFSGSKRRCARWTDEIRHTPDRLPWHYP
jgi:hypothetical protein